MKILLNIKTDKEVKIGVQKIAKELGVPLSTIINAYLKQLLREKRVSFELPLKPNAQTAKLIRQARADYKKGKNISPVFTTAEEIDAYLHAPDI
jgi:DNA-damage-inducible protein J